eukprot:SAG11_NODE_557_length_8549_cov_5.574675_7_plen_173_part_01
MAWKLGGTELFKAPHIFCCNIVRSELFSRSRVWTRAPAEQLDAGAAHRRFRAWISAVRGAGCPRSYRFRRCCSKLAEPRRHASAEEDAIWPLLVPLLPTRAGAGYYLQVRWNRWQAAAKKETSCGGDSLVNVLHNIFDPLYMADSADSPVNFNGSATDWPSVETLELGRFHGR